MAAMPRESRYSAFIFERRLLMGFTGFTVLGTIIWVVALSTEYWYVVDVPNSIYIEASNEYFLRSNGGLFRVCRVAMVNGTVIDTESMFIISKCQYRHVLGSEKEENPQVNERVIEFIRTEIAFTVISLLLMLMGHAFAMYTFRETRYMFKRLTSGVHFITAAVVLVVNERLMSRVNLERTALLHPTEIHWYYGYSFTLAWITFIAYVSSGLTFLVCSRKKKRDKAPTEAIAIEDEPNIISR